MPVDVWSLSRVSERTSDGKTIDGYLIHVANSSPKSEQVICLDLHSIDTSERGMGCVSFNGKHGGVKK